MANSIITLSAGDVTRKALSILHNKLVFTKKVNRQYNDKFARTGAKNGGVLDVRLPNEFTVRTGSTLAAQDVEERTTPVTVATQMGVDVNFSSTELTLSLDDFGERILEPAMSRLAAEIDSTAIAAALPYIANFENTTFGTAPVLSDVLAAKAMLNQSGAPSDNRYLMTESLATNSIITAGYNIYNPADEISRQYKTGMLGSIYGMEHYESELTPTHTNGTRTDSTPVTDLSGWANGDTTITISGWTADQTLLAGDVFTVAGVYAVNYETKTPYAKLKQFVCTTDTTLTGTSDAIPVGEKIYISGAHQNCYNSAWTDTSAAVVSVAAGGSGTADTSFVNSLFFHRDSFAFVTADLEMPQGVDFAARKVYDGISMRIVRAYDISSDKFPCRIDVLCGTSPLYNQWAGRMCS